MTADRFAALCALLPGEHGLARDAARLVLVEGYSRNQAARAVGGQLSAVSRILRRIQQIDRDGCPTCKRRIDQ